MGAGEIVGRRPRWAGSGVALDATIAVIAQRHHFGMRHWHRRLASAGQRQQAQEQQERLLQHHSPPHQPFQHRELKHARSPRGFMMRAFATTWRRSGDLR